MARRHQHRRRRRDPRPAGDAVAAWLRRARSTSADGGLDAIRSCLARAGESPEEAIPIRLSRAGVLTVACATAGIAQRVASDSDRLLRSLAACAPKVRVVSLRPVVADQAIVRVQRPAPAKPVRPSAQDMEQGARIAEGVHDPRLRELISRAAAARLAIDRRDSPS